MVRCAAPVALRRSRPAGLAAPLVSAALISVTFVACSFGAVQPTGADEAATAGPAPAETCARFVTGKQTHNGLLLGLSVVDDKGESLTQPFIIGCRSPVAVFVHGWSMAGPPTSFEHAALWRARGFVTMVFRWHDKSSSAEFAEVFTQGSVEAAKSLASELRALRAQLGPRFSGELRLIGHSFGAKVAADVTSQLSDIEGTAAYDAALMTASEAKGASASYRSPLGGPLATPRAVAISRLTLLDPAVFVDWTRDELSLCPLLRIGFGAQKPDILERESPVQVEAGRLLALMSLIPPSTRVEIYATNVASTFAYSLAKKFPVQTLTRATVLGCYMSFEGLNMVQVHNSVVPGYLSSVAQQAPILLTSGDQVPTNGVVHLNAASVPTAELKTSPGWYVLRTGAPDRDWGSHQFAKRDIPGQYLKLEAGSACLNVGASFEDCSVGIKYVKKF